MHQRRSIIRSWTSRIGQSPGRVPSRHIPPPPPPPPPAPIPHGNATFNAVTYPREWTPLHTRPKASGGAGPPDGPGGGTGSGAESQPNPAGNPHPGGGAPGSSGSRGAQPPGKGHPGGCPGGNGTPPSSTPAQQTGGAGIQVAARRPHLQGSLNTEGILIHGPPWTDQENLCRSFHCPLIIRVAAL